MLCLNASLYIVIQCGASGIAWGGTGVGKSAFFKALAKALGKKFFCFIPSQHMPEDIGGLPHIDAKKLLARMIHMEWMQALREDGWMILIDELTTAPQSMRPPLLSILNEGCVGDLVFHPNTIRVAAANPPELAPNSSPLEASMLNRLYHHNWVTPFDSWLDGMMNGGDFKVPANMPIVGDYSTYLPKWTRRIGYLCKKHPEIRETHTVPENERAFPSLRQWFNLAKCLAGANKVQADGDVIEEIASGMVGSAAAGMLMKMIASSDLYDPADLVDRKKKIDFANDRIDQLYHLPIGVLEVLESDLRAKQVSSTRMDNACEVLIEMGEHGLLDCCAPVLSDITNKFDGYRMPKKLVARYGQLVSQIGGAA